MLVLTAACIGPRLRADRTRLEPSFASPPAEVGILAELAGSVLEAHGPEHSAFELLDGSQEALQWRLALIDSAVSSLDLQTYLWYPDTSGRLILERAVLAAERGVRVRLIVDDLLTLGLDQLVYELDRRPNIELRLFNPWENRGTVARTAEMLVRMERLNTRMHDKLIVVDGRAAIVGGRNIGDHYFGLNHEYNFHDLDVLAIGHFASQASSMFDDFWNSDWLVSAGSIDTEPDPEYVAGEWRKIRELNRAAPELQAFPREPLDWTDELEALFARMHPGTSRLVYDAPSSDSVTQQMGATIFDFMERADNELLITNAYVIPSQKGIDFVRALTQRGVRTRILTNSLASHDVPAVNSHYEAWRDDLLDAGVELFELRADAAIDALVSVPPVEAHFVGLHTKAVVVDREQAFVGSMNLDPRSFEINAEGGVFIQSRGLGEELARLMERDMQPDNAWQVIFGDDGELRWVSDLGVRTEQPARSGTQQVMNLFFKVLPKDQF